MRVPQATAEVDEADRTQHLILNHVWQHGGDHCPCCDCLTCGECWACGDCACPAPVLEIPSVCDVSNPSMTWHPRPGDDNYTGPAVAPFPSLLESTPKKAPHEDH